MKKMPGSITLPSQPVETDQISTKVCEPSIHYGPGRDIEVLASDGSGAIGGQKEDGFGNILRRHHAAKRGIASKVEARFLQADAFNSGLFADDALDTLALHCSW